MIKKILKNKLLYLNKRYFNQINKLAILVLKNKNIFFMLYVYNMLYASDY